MNPARTIGPAIASNYYNGLWVYFIGPVVGALLGAWSYGFVRIKDKASPSNLKDDQEVTAEDPPNTFFSTKTPQAEPAFDNPTGYQSRCTA